MRKGSYIIAEKNLEILFSPLAHFYTRTFLLEGRFWGLLVFPTLKHKNILNLCSYKKKQKKNKWPRASFRVKKCCLTHTKRCEGVCFHVKTVLLFSSSPVLDYKNRNQKTNQKLNKNISRGGSMRGMGTNMLIKGAKNVSKSRNSNQILFAEIKMIGKLSRN